MSTFAIMSLPLDERPAALQREDARPRREPKPGSMLGIELLIDQIEADAHAMLRACAEMRRAAGDDNLAATNEAALTARADTRDAESLATAVQSWVSGRRRRESKVRG